MYRSPPFERTIPAGDIAASGKKTFDFEHTWNDEASWSPFNQLTISNFSGQRLRVTYAGGHYKHVRPNSSMMIEQYGIRSITIENLDTSNANDDIIEIIIQREVTEKHLEIAKITGKPLMDVIKGIGW